MQTIQFSSKFFPYLCSYFFPNPYNEDEKIYRLKWGEVGKEFPMDFPFKIIISNLRLIDKIG